MKFLPLLLLASSVGAQVPFERIVSADKERGTGLRIRAICRVIGIRRFEKSTSKTFRA
jgi:hypothetical protein